METIVFIGLGVVAYGIFIASAVADKKSTTRLLALPAFLLFGYFTLRNARLVFFSDISGWGRFGFFALGLLTVACTLLSSILLIQGDMGSTIAHGNGQHTATGNGGVRPAAGATSGGSTGYFYAGSSATGQYTCTYENGKIIERGKIMGPVIGCYKNGCVFKGSMDSGFYNAELTGRYIVARGGKKLATYENGFVKDISTGRTVGRYEGSDEGGAAAAYIYLYADR